MYVHVHMFMYVFRGDHLGTGQPICMLFPGDTAEVVSLICSLLREILDLTIHNVVYYVS